MNPFTHNITRLFDFNGRQNRQPFWLWVLICYGFQMIVGIVVMIPLMMSYFGAMESVFGQDQAYLRDHPEIAQQAMMKAMGPFMNGAMTISLLLAIILTVLLAAAAVRRLHDSNRSGWWGAPVLALQIAMPIVNIGVFSQMFEQMQKLTPGVSPEQANAMMAPMMAQFAAVWALGMLSFVLTIVLVVFLCLRGTLGPNRFGADPLGVPGLAEFEPMPR